MNETKRKRLEAAGWRIGSVADFLELSPEEEALTGIRVALIRALRERRKERGLTQVQLARKIGSSQSRVAKMERGDGASIDRMIHALLALGATAEDIAQILRQAS